MVEAITETAITETGGGQPEGADILAAATLALLTQPLDPRLIARRQAGRGQTVAYLEGHQAINQANRIFGHGRWGAELVGPVGYRELVRVDRRTGETQSVGMYWATVRVRSAGCVPRSDVGCAFTTDESPEAHDTAIKGAVTDAMKRALRQLGDQFGNALYDRNGPSRAENGHDLEDLRAVALALGAQLGLDAAATREQVGRRAGKPFDAMQSADLARVLRAMAQALCRNQQAA